MNLKPASVLVLLALAGGLRGQSLQLPVAAIFDARHLSAAEFREVHPGRPVNGQPVDLGWFVHYHHENLDYHFGPLTSAAAAEVYRRELADVFGEALKERPALAKATIEVYENKAKPAPTPPPPPSTTTKPPAPSGSPSAPPPAVSVPVPTPLPPPPPPTPEDSLWKRFKRWLGW